MKINDLFERLKGLHPHQYEEEELIEWLNACEEEIAAYLQLFTDDEIENVKHTYTTESTLIDEPQVYLPYLYAQICAANEEYGRYNNQAIIYANELQKWKTRYIQTHRPTDKGYVRNLV